MSVSTYFSKDSLSTIFYRLTARTNPIRDHTTVDAASVQLTIDRRRGTANSWAILVALVSVLKRCGYTLYDCTLAFASPDTHLTSAPSPVTVGVDRYETDVIVKDPIDRLAEMHNKRVVVALQPDPDKGNDLSQLYVMPDERNRIFLTTALALVQEAGLGIQDCLKVMVGTDPRFVVIDKTTLQFLVHHAGPSVLLEKAQAESGIVRQDNEGVDNEPPDVCSARLTETMAAVEALLK